MNISQNLEAWEALVLTAKTGNVSKTALLLDMDIPKVSRLISSLEKNLATNYWIKAKRPFQAHKRNVKLLFLLLSRSSKSFPPDAGFFKRGCA